jgi:hypothetical protein
MRGGDGLGRRAEIGVEVLHAEHVRIVTGGRRNAIDAEPRNVVQARDAHARLLLTPPRR